jgi:hypothetical protein
VRERDDRLLDRSEWTRAASSSSSLYIEVSQTEWAAIVGDTALRTRLEEFLATQHDGVLSLLFVHVDVPNPPQSVAELYRDGTGVMLWQLVRPLRSSS